MKRDKVNLDIFWLKDNALEDSANLPAPEIIAAEIAEDLQAALEQFATIAENGPHFCWRYLPKPKCAFAGHWYFRYE